MLSRWPYDAKTPFSYLTAFLDETITQIVGMSTYAALVSFFTGSGWLFMSIIDDIMNDLSVFQSEHISKTNATELKRSFGNIVMLYADVKKLSKIEFSRF